MLKKKLVKSGVFYSLFFAIFYILYWNIPYLNFFEYFELKTYDLRFKFLNNFSTKKDFDVVIIGIDEKSLLEHGPWPFERNLHGDLVDILNKNGIKSIGFDISFNDQGTNSKLLPYKNNLKNILNEAYKKDEISQNYALSLAKEINKLKVDEDFVFSSIMSKYKNVTLGTYNILDESEIDNEQILSRNLHEKSRFYRLQGVEEELYKQNIDNSQKKNLYEVYKILPPIDILANSAFGVGPYEIGYPDLDGVVRGIVAITKEKYSNSYFPPLYLTTYINSLGLNSRDNLVYNIDKNQIEIKLNSKILKIIPLDKNGYQRLFYYGKGHTFPYISYTDVINGSFEVEEINNKIALIGYTDSAKGLYDLRSTPLDPNMAGVELHANAIQNVIDNNYLIRIKQSKNFLLILLSLLIITILLSQKNRNIIRINLIIIFYIFSYIFLSVYFFNKGLWVDVFYPLISMVLTYLFLNTENYFREGLEKKYIREVFGTYINPQLIEELIDNPEKLKLGGEEREVTSFFSDIVSFTSISEGLKPEELIEVLNEYLSITTDIILSNQGTIDKYIGDAIMAIFGAPVYKKSHAHDACKSALLYQKSLVKLREKEKKEGKNILRARIGINTGPAVVGNMGCNIGNKKKFNYSVIGDSVNLASRLESASKFYSTEILVGEGTYELVKDDFNFRFIDFVKVKGKKNAVPIYELLDEQVPFINDYNLGIRLYKERKFLNALEIFTKIYEKYNDGPSKVYIDRLNEYLLNPPLENWDYSFTMKTK